MKKDNKNRLVNTPVEDFRKKFGFSAANHRAQEEINKIVRTSRKINSPDSCHKLLSEIGTMLQGTADGPEELAPRLIKGETGSLEEVTIKFHLQGSKPLQNAPERTLCRPDIVVYNGKRLTVPQDEAPVSARTRSNTPNNATSTQGSTQSYTTEDDLSWTQTEATSEYLSAGDTNEIGLEKAISYTVVHLLSRPDRVVVPGFFFGPKTFNLIFTGVTGTCHTLLEWKNPDHIQLLFEFVRRIFEPSPEMLDPNIVRNTDDTFDVTLKENKYPKCKILSLTRPVERRTTIFETSDPDVPVIKEQYLTSRSVEYDILGQVSNVPGVVQLEDYEEYRPEDQSTVGCTIGERPRYKVRLALRDKGVSIKESKTLKQFLIWLYDTLEVAECLHELKVLHRDYSLNNVLSREPTVREEWKDLTFCSARHLLDPDVDRLETGVLLIDFEHATDLETQEPLETAGTPLYQARAAQTLAPLEHWGTVPGMPELIPEALEHYQKAVPKRLDKFIPDKTKHFLEMPSDGDTREWRHELRHDTESAFWMLLYWVVIFQPVDDQTPSTIPWAFWAVFTTESERGSLLWRVQVKEVGETKTTWVHPDFDRVRELLGDMAAHLNGELQWLTEEDKCYDQMKKKSYLREVFQRLILNFLFKYQDEPFMTKERHKGNRSVEEMFQQSTNLFGLEIASKESGRSSVAKRAREEEDQQGAEKRRKGNPTSDDSDDSDYKP
jgi:hypothetical protein